MMPFLRRTWKFLSEIVDVLAMAAIGIPGVAIVYLNGWPNFWPTLALTVVFLALAATFSGCYEGLGHRWAHLYLLVQTAITVTLFLWHPSLTFYIIWFYVLSIEATMVLPRRAANAWIAAFIIAMIVILLAGTNLATALITMPIYLAGFFFFITFANATRQANQARQESQRLLEELQTAHRKLQEYAAQAETLAVAEERNRLAREMHDTIGHRLTVAAVQLEGVQRLIRHDPDKAEHMAATVREQVRAALQELRQTVATLREPLEADLPLGVSLQRLAAEFERATGIAVHLLLPGDLPGLSAAHRLALYRTAQESLTNVQKHARADQVWMQVSQQDGVITLRVSDNGVGLSERETESGFGLRGIRERAAQLGGDLKLETRPGGGAQLLLCLPLGGGADA